MLRDVETHRRGRLSVQASEFHYCTPRENYTDLDMYDTFEVGVFAGDGGLTLPSATLGRIYRLLPFLPLARQARSLDALFEQDCSSPVAGYVKPADVDRIRNLLT